jgi:hypothetical protein
MERREERLIYRFTREENGLTLRRYWTSSCGACAIKSQSTPSTQRRVARWEHERLLEAEQRRAVEVVAVSAPRSSSSTKTSIARTGLFSPINHPGTSEKARSAPDPPLRQSTS